MKNVDHKDDLKDLRAANEAEHKAILATLSDLISDKKALRLFGLILGIAIGAIVGTVTYFANKLDDVKTGAETHEAKGLEMGMGLRRDVTKNERNIDELRRLHRLPRDSNGVGPQE